MKKNLVAWILFVTVLLPGSAVIGDEYTIIPEKKGETVQRDGNNVTDTFIEAARVNQVELDKCREKVDEAPADEAKTYVNGLTTGGALGLLLAVLLL